MPKRPLTTKEQTEAVMYGERIMRLTPQGRAAIFQMILALEALLPIEAQ
jgi:hypothetical protein